MNTNQAINDINDNFRDGRGLIAYKNKDGSFNGGDTLQMTAFYYYVNSLYGNLPHGLPRDLNLLNVGKGVYIRHPDRAPGWDQPGQRDIARWNDPKVLSRDNLMPLIILLGSLGYQGQLNEVLWKVAKRGFRSQNGDLIWMHHFSACFIRTKRSTWLKPLLYVTDLFLVIGALIDVFRYWTGNKSGKGYKNTLILLSQSLRQPTILSKLSIFIYKLRPGGLQAGIDHAYGAEDDPPFNELWREYIKKHLS